MSKLEDFLLKRRAKFYEGDTLKKMCASFMQMVDDGAAVHEYEDAIIVLEPYGLPGNVRAWLLFDGFTRGVFRAIKAVDNGIKSGSVYASTHDPRVKIMLSRIGFVEYAKDDHDFYLKKAYHGM